MATNDQDLSKSKVEKTTRGKKKGSDKSGGRQKGTPNKNSFLFRLALDDAGFNIVEELRKQYCSLTEPNEKISVLMRMMPFLYPVLKEVEADALPKSDPLAKAASGGAKSGTLLAIQKSLK